ncbi:hypothetical protein JYQ62_28075 [Nostoc sp. UHCC 0702]|nr:hypothetical protein JYQ62_28075 [Nostoc sp. UHCC 0702]
MAVISHQSSIISQPALLSLHKSSVITSGITHSFTTIYTNYSLFLLTKPSLWEYYLNNAHRQGFAVDVVPVNVGTKQLAIGGE